MEGMVNIDIYLQNENTKEAGLAPVALGAKIGTKVDSEGIKEEPIINTVLCYAVFKK